jgi:ABC-type uncharacterized transport system substrate-binding protein
MALAEELVRLKLEVIVTAGSGATRVAKAATPTIPIVMSSDDDPVGNGLVASLARPGGNITGLSQLASELSGKRLEILKETIPKLPRLAVFSTSTDVSNAQAMKEIELAAAALGVKLQQIDVLTPKDIEYAFRAAVKGRADAVLDNISGSIRSTVRKELAELAVKNRLPVMRRTAGTRGNWRAHVLWRLLAQPGSALCHVRGQNSQRHEASQHTGGTADKV